jgi:uncharacterized protein
MKYLADANVLVALVVPQHEHHVRAHRFFSRRAYAVTPLTQLATLQILSRPRRLGEQMLPALHAAQEALRMVRLLSNKRGVRFIPADLNCASRLNFEAVAGHRQWNDFYLVALAEKNGLVLATFDEVIARTFAEWVRLIP